MTKSCASFLWFQFYLQARFTWKGSKLLRHLLQAVVIYAAVYVGLSRISDYKHHWSDVLMGAILGTLLAALTVRSIRNHWFFSWFVHWNLHKLVSRIIIYFIKYATCYAPVVHIHFRTVLSSFLLYTQIMTAIHAVLKFRNFVKDEERGIFIWLKHFTKKFSVLLNLSKET